MNESRNVGKRGFTLIEGVISIVMLSFFALSILMFAKPATDLWALQSFQQGPVTEGRLALMRMVREINQVKDRSSISIATATRFSFTNTSNQTVDFNLSSGNVTRNSVVLAKSVSSLQFTYYDVNNATTTTKANIRRVSIAMTITAGTRSATIRSQSQPRGVY